jgi:hypothetical protein
MRQSHPPWQRRGQRFRFCDLGLHARENEKTAQHDKKAAYPQADGANELAHRLPKNLSHQAGRKGDQPSARFIPGNCVEIAFGAITRE